MAAPPSKNVLNMTGVWQINRTLSDDINPLFVLQGIPWILRKIINFATVQLSMKQGTLSPRDPEKDKSKITPIATIHVTQIVTPGNFNSQDTYVLDSVSRESTVPIFGKIAVEAKYTTFADIEDAEVRAKFERSSEPQTSIVETVKSMGSGWEITSVWCFENIESERRYCRYSVAHKGDQELRLKLVYDFVREL